MTSAASLLMNHLSAEVTVPEDATSETLLQSVIFKSVSFRGAYPSQSVFVSFKYRCVHFSSHGPEYFGFKQCLFNVRLGILIEVIPN